jgi:hypothetical protein
MSYSINGIGGTKRITRQIFAGASPPPPANDSRSKTEQLIGGTWTFSYTIINGFTNRYTFTSITGPDRDGDWLALGTGEFGDKVGGGYVSSTRLWGVLDPGTIIDRFFVFTFSDLNTVSGCYYQVDPPGSTHLSRCYSMLGFRSPRKDLEFDTAAGSPEALERFAKAAVAADRVAGPPEPGHLELYLEIRRKLETGKQ